MPKHFTSRHIAIAALLLTVFVAGSFFQSLFSDRNMVNASINASQINSIPAQLLIAGLRIRVVSESGYFEGEIIQNEGSWVKFQAPDGERWINTAAYSAAWQILSEKN